ncbi:MAG: CRISPR-associated helicase Cas3' [Candidatus Helarchaeota archaeon]
MVSNNEILRIWGKTKPKHPLIYHLIDVGCVAYHIMGSKTYKPVVEKVSKMVGIEYELIKSWISYLIAMHDIGKCYPEFQIFGLDEDVNELRRMGLIPKDFKVEVFYHSEESAIWIKEYLKSVGWNRRSVDVITRVVLGHHGYFKAKNNRIDNNLNERWEEFRVKIKDILLSLFAVPGVGKDDFEKSWVPDEFELPNMVGIIILGLLVLSDWIASNDYLYDYKLINNIPCSIEQYFSKAMLLGGKIVNKLGFNIIIDIEQAIEKEQKITFSGLFPVFKRLTTIQKMVESAIERVPEIVKTPNLVIIEASTGSGKTEAALYYMTKILENKKVRGFYFALPTIAASDQIYERVREFIGRFSRGLKKYIRLVHGMAWVVDKASYRFRKIQISDINPLNSNESGELDEGENFYRWFLPKRRAILVPYAVGTIDQALMSVLNVKFGFLRLLGFSKNVLIVDEVHAYDVYMKHILERLLEWTSYLGITVILLSATIPDSKKRELMNAYLRGVSLNNNDMGVAEMVGTSTYYMNGKNNRSMEQEYPLITIIGSLRNSYYITKSKIKKIISKKIENKGVKNVNSENNVNNPNNPNEYDSNNNLKQIMNISYQMEEFSHKIDIKSDSPYIREVIIKKHYGYLEKYDDCADLIIDIMKRDRCVCYIANTVSSAQEMYKKVQEKLKLLDINIPVILLHSRFPKEHRMDIENIVRDFFDKRSIPDIKGNCETTRPEKAILISTQIVEQSLDLDFDEIVSEIAPIDLLIQRIGRLHRHKREGRDYEPTFHIILPDTEKFEFGSISYIYSPYILYKTYLTIKNINKINIPSEVRELINYTYNEDINNLKYDDIVPEHIVEEEYERYCSKLEEDKNKADVYLIPSPRSRDFVYTRQNNDPFKEGDENMTLYFYAKTRIGNYTENVILLDIDSFKTKYAKILEEKESPSKEILSELLYKTIPIPRSWLKIIFKKLRSAGIEWWDTGADIESNYSPIIVGPKWLFRTKIILMKRIDNFNWELYLNFDKNSENNVSIDNNINDNNDDNRDNDDNDFYKLVYNKFIGLQLV